MTLFLQVPCFLFYYLCAFDSSQNSPDQAILHDWMNGVLNSSKRSLATILFSKRL